MGGGDRTEVTHGRQPGKERRQLARARPPRPLQWCSSQNPAAEMATKVRFSEERTNICFLPFGARIVRGARADTIQGLCQSRKSVIQALRPASKGREYPKHREIFPCRGT